MNQNLRVESEVAKQGLTIAQATANYKAKSASRDVCLSADVIAAVIEQGAKVELKNDSYEHALEYTEQMLLHTTKSINILTGGACVYAVLIECLTDSLKRIRKVGGTAKMIVLSKNIPEWIEVLAQEFSGTLEVARHDSAEPLEHFIVCDSKTVRIEKIHEELTPSTPADAIKANVIFNEPAKGSELEKNFSVLWGKAKVSQFSSENKSHAPSWLIQRMEALQQRQPLTSQRMLEQWDDLAEFNPRSKSKQTVS